MVPSFSALSYVGVASRSFPLCWKQFSSSGFVFLFLLILYSDLQLDIKSGFYNSLVPKPWTVIENAFILTSVLLLLLIQISKQVLMLSRELKFFWLLWTKFMMQQ